MSRYILVTGSTDGIGRETVVGLATLPSVSKLIIHGRNKEKCQKTLQYIQSKSGCDASLLGYVSGDFGVMAEVGKMAEDIKGKFPQLNTLVCNAGVLLPQRSESADGLEMAFQVNHLPHFALVNLLLPLLTSNTPSRVAVVSSICYDWHPMDWEDLMAKKNYEKYVQYSRTKLMNHLFGFAMARRLEGSGVCCNILEPGVIETKLLRNGGYSGAPVSKGAITPIYLASSSEVEGVSGKYFNNNKKMVEASTESKNEKAQERLWEISVDLCRKFGITFA